MTVSAPSSITPGVPYNLTFKYNLAGAQDGDVYYGLVTLGSSAATPNDFGRIPVNIRRIGNDVTKTASKSVAAVGDVVTYTLSIQNPGGAAFGELILHHALDDVGADFRDREDVIADIERTGRFRIEGFDVEFHGLGARSLLERGRRRRAFRAGRTHRIADLDPRIVGARHRALDKNKPAFGIDADDL